MSIDRLQQKIRKSKNPSVVDFDITQAHIPPHIMAEEGKLVKAYIRFCMELMDSLRGIVPAVKFNFGGFALLGTEGLTALSKLLDHARSRGYYVILEAPDALTAQRAQSNADLIFSDEENWPCDAVLISAYIGSDSIKPYAAKLEQYDKALFVTTRTGNRSAMELQDLLTGGRHVFEAKSDIVNRYKNSQATKSGYDRVALVGPATSAAILQKLREKYKNLFILVDAYDSPSANAKNCAEAADKLGHGVAVCSGTNLTAAWLVEDHDGTEYLTDALDAAERMKKNLSRYFTVL